MLTSTTLYSRVGFGYKFKRKVAISFNADSDYHCNYATSTFPTYRTLKYNFTEFDDDALFTEMNYGKIWLHSKNYPFEIIIDL